MKKFWVYIHTCPNGKKYVGATTRIKPEIRWVEGNGYQFNKCFYFDILKYGWNNITHEVFEVDSAEEMYRKEIELISFYHSNDPRYGYNNSVGGKYGHLGCKCSEKTRKRIAQALKGKPLSKEHRQHIAEAAKERASDPEYPKKLSEAAKKRWSDPEVRKKQSEVAKNRPRIKIQLPDGTIVEITKQNLTKCYINKGKTFEYVS